jgi:hypothetical protein
MGHLHAEQGSVFLAFDAHISAYYTFLSTLDFLQYQLKHGSNLNAGVWTLMASGAKSITGLCLCLGRPALA